MQPIPINGADGMDHILGRKRARSADDGTAGWTAAGAGANFVQLAHDRGPAGAMDGAIHAPTPAQARIGGVNNGVDTDLGDIANYQTEFFPVREINLHDL